MQLQAFLSVLSTLVLGSLASPAAYMFANTPTAPSDNAVLSPQSLTLTALVSKDGLSGLECWVLTPALVSSTAEGTIGALSYSNLGALGNSSYDLFTELTNAGLHNAPAPQYVIILRGQGELSFPSADPANVTLTGNYTLHAGDILIVQDTAELSFRGHNSVWQPGTSTLQLPFASGAAPEHVVLHEGGCKRPHM
ncbi:hypothetical protein D9758_017169 [Tetrapyrgos nigripes]|uniref:Uncharacterized protein n=1 Tax=Tetrapyrgos nigripes TaxID=182062 RepID=A0A8H5FI52_9AGAR|nr:hypothetical protein D9758_017169 [Tetrapyrgos nigripes]